MHAFELLKRVRMLRDRQDTRAYLGHWTFRSLTFRCRSWWFWILSYLPFSLLKLLVNTIIITLTNLVNVLPLNIRICLRVLFLFVYYLFFLITNPIYCYNHLFVFVFLLLLLLFFFFFGYFFFLFWLCLFFFFAFINSCGFEQAYRLVYSYLLLIYSRHRPFTYFLLILCVYLNCIS